MNDKERLEKELSQDQSFKIYENSFIRYISLFIVKNPINNFLTHHKGVKTIFNELNKT